MKIQDALLEDYHDGELSNRLYALHELNRREQSATDRKARLYICAMAGLGTFMIVLAIIAGRA